MTQIVVGKNEGIESTLRRFKREVSQAGIFQSHLETPLQKHKRKTVARHKQQGNNRRLRA